MSLWSDEQLSAYVDGELPAPDAMALETDLESDPHLAQRLAHVLAANNLALIAAKEIDKAPMSAGLSALIEQAGGGNVIPFRRKGLLAVVAEHRAIAAGLVCAAAVWGANLMLDGNSSPLPAAGVVMAESSRLHGVLTSSPTGDSTQLEDGSVATPRLTFASADGAFCRQFDVSGAGGTVQAIACRDGDVWRTEIAAVAPAVAEGDYQTASSGRSSAIESFIDERIEGAPLNAAGEAALLSDWNGKDKR